MQWSFLPQYIGLSWNLGLLGLLNNRTQCNKMPGIKVCNRDKQKKQCIDLHKLFISNHIKFHSQHKKFREGGGRGHVDFAEHRQTVNH